MADLYVKPSIGASYNQTPPSDDGATTTTNEVKWQTHIDKIGDPIKNFVDAINTEADTGFASISAALTFTGTTTEALGMLQLKSYTVAGLPTATAGAMIYVSNETGGATVAFSDGSSWYRVQDRALVS